MNHIPTIFLAVKRGKQDYFQAHGEATQACLQRLLAIADFILRHPQTAAVPFEMTISGGLNDARFVVAEPIQLAQVSREIQAIQPSRPGVTQGASLSFIYFDSNGDRMRDPATDDFLGIAPERTVPSRLIEHLDTV